MLLAIDSSTQILSIALHDGVSLLAECTLSTGRQHSALLAPLTQQILAQLSLSARDLGALAVSVGPGSYTGLRIGVAFAKGMAAVGELPLVPVTTLETIVAAQSSRQTDAQLVATLPAGRNRAIWAEYQRRGECWHETRSPQISAWCDLLEACGEPCLISGEITAAGLSAIEEARQSGKRIAMLPAAERLRRAGTIADIAWQRLRAEDAQGRFPASQVMPIYLKSPG